MKNAREKNIEAGIILFSLISFFIYISTRYVYAGYILFADLQLLIGAIIGIRFTLKNQKAEQATLKTGVITGIGGGVLATLFISVFEWIAYSLERGINILALFWFIIYTIIAGVVIGLIMGAIMSTLYMYKEVKRPEEDKHIDEDFFKDLIED
ncbi:MAG: hypothetical protein ACFFAQ_10990 [Promethearchaeota archaeon]